MSHKKIMSPLTCAAQWEKIRLKTVFCFHSEMTSDLFEPTSGINSSISPVNLILQYFMQQKMNKMSRADGLVLGITESNLME